VIGILVLLFYLALGVLTSVVMAKRGLFDPEVPGDVLAAMAVFIWWPLVLVCSALYWATKQVVYLGRSFR
jgi:hypothetical protein